VSSFFKAAKKVFQPANVEEPTPYTHERGAKRKKSDRIGYLTAEELDAPLKAVRSGGRVRDIAIFELAAGRGPRRGEVGLILMEHLRLNVKRVTLAVFRLILSRNPFVSMLCRRVEGWSKSL
jgi:hypothetical protein